MTLRIRPATAADAPRVAAVYGYYVTDTVITFELDVPPPAEWARRIEAATVFVVGEVEDAVVGFAYVTAWKTRAAYRFTGEDSIYLDPAARGRGYGRALLDGLLDASRAAGLRRIIATIADAGSAASVRLHAAAGFRPAGRLEQVGRKFDRWIDVELMQLDLDRAPRAPRNPFLATDTAQDYALARPDYHPSAIAAAVRLLELRGRVDVAIDVGCGTGMSSRALAAVADLVLGVDVSRAMLAAATARPGVHHARAAAERLPVRDGAAGLVVTAAAFHWFDQEAMLAETARVLRPGGGFACYSDFHGGGLPAAPEAARWLRESYRPRYPAPPRHGHDNAPAVAAAGLELVGAAELAHDVPMTAATLTDYLLSQSNATAAIDAGRVTRDELRTHVRSELAARMPAGPVPVPFTGRVWCARRPGGAATPAPPRPAPAGTP